MNSETNLRVLSSATVFPELNFSPAHMISRESFPPQGTSALWLIPCAMLAVAALALAADANAQQPYSGAPYDNSGGQYAPQYAEPAPQNGYAPPQIQAPQFQPPAPPQPYPDQQPQYAPQPYADQNQAPPYDQQDQSQAPATAQALSAQDLEQLLAPIALYPDSLLAQILAASTYPAQVAVADQWLQQMRAQGYSSPDQIAAGANAQTNWDPSIKALTAFPDVLDLMNHDLEWTTNLGNAYYNQPQDVMQTVQVLRDRAEQAGNLQSTPQEEVNERPGLRRAGSDESAGSVCSHLQSMGCVWGAHRTVSRIFVFWRAGQLFRWRSHSIRTQLRSGSLRSLAFWLDGMGLRLGGARVDVQPFRLLHPQQPSGRLGFAARRATITLWPRRLVGRSRGFL